MFSREWEESMMCLALVALSLLGISVLSVHAEDTAPPYLDASNPIEARVADLVSRMTLEEKAA